MLRLLPAAVAVCAASSLFSATFGTATGPSGGASYSDIVLDEARTQLYLVNSANNKIDIYNYKTKAFLTSVPVSSQPVAAALGAPVNGTSRYLYVTAYASSSLYQIDLTAKNGPAVSTRISLPYNPEGVGVGGDGRVLVTTIGCTASPSCTGAANTNTLFLFDPNATTSANLTAISLPLPPPTSPVTPTVPGREFLAYRGALMATPDGKYIVGVNGVSGTVRLIFIYETSSATILRSREVTNLSNVVSVAPDSSRFMAGSVMFDIATLQVIAQENVSNSPFAFPSGNAANFNTAANQGGSVFTPDGTQLYAAFNINPVQTPAAKANVSQLLINDPTNLLIQMGIQLPENLAGKMVITKAGDTIYAISDSGFITLPVSTISSSPLAAVTSQLVFLANDQCGVTLPIAKSVSNVNNTGKGRMSVTVTGYTIPAQGTAGLGGFGGPGGGGIFGGIGGGGIIIIIP
jgi:hypothetical protein